MNSPIRGTPEHSAAVTGHRCGRFRPDQPQNRVFGACPLRGRVLGATAPRAALRLGHPVTPAHAFAKFKTSGPSRKCSRNGDVSTDATLPEFVACSLHRYNSDKVGADCHGGRVCSRRWDPANLLIKSHCGQGTERDITLRRQQAPRQRAYAIWEEEGRPSGRDLDHWQRAEAELNVNELDSSSETGCVPLALSNALLVARVFSRTFAR